MLVRHSTRKIRFPINQSDLSRSRNAWLPPGLGRWVSLERLLVANGLIKLVPVLWKSGRCTWDLIYIITLENIQQSTIPSNKSVNSRLPECGECHCRSCAGLRLGEDSSLFEHVLEPGRSWPFRILHFWNLPVRTGRPQFDLLYRWVQAEMKRERERERKGYDIIWSFSQVYNTCKVEVNVLACWHKPT